MSQFEDTDPAGRLAAVLREHAAVADAAVEVPDGGGPAVVRLVPDPERAPLLHRSAAVEAAGRLGPLGWHEPAADLRVAGVNRSESDFLHREIFVDDVYFRHGVDLPAGAVVVDVGANIGMFTLCAARRSPGARIIACEPLAELAAAVAVNAEVHAADVTVVARAVGAAEGEADFTFYPHNSVMSGAFADADADRRTLRGYLLTGADSEGVDPQDRLVADRLAADLLAAEHRRVAVTTLARIAADHGLTRIDLLKIDVEKAEEDVLRGITPELWAGIRQIVMEVHDIDGRLASVTKTLEDRGFGVVHEQDPRLADTACVNVYARRPGAPGDTGARPPGTAHRPDPGPVLWRLEAELRDLLARRLPGTPAPGRFELTTDLGAAGERAAEVPRATVPHSARAEVFARVWAGIFGAEAVRPDADFFDLGGDSLTAMRLLTRLEEQLGEDALEPDLIFTVGTFGALAAAVEASGEQPSGPARSR
ncbi:FkbM family methyltransferase [Streptomyces sp. NRRL B-3648]|uniref:FkbM family methyltransferase n=1 Tax=Streptomyces sp. NRRL B-3648 TaxID=1519493 RepID=UPI0006AFD16E|nr:FkbM family methyltransferase [Streptomyces sp. NRRL B-3648]KOV93032.1 31-O-demethyl-FK506 methyltransferase [Streptomyces sp. NRRL B-3648]